MSKKDTKSLLNSKTLFGNSSLLAHLPDMDDLAHAKIRYCTRPKHLHLKNSDLNTDPYRTPQLASNFAEHISPVVT